MDTYQIVYQNKETGARSIMTAREDMMEANVLVIINDPTVRLLSVTRNLTVGE